MKRAAQLAGAASLAQGASRARVPFCAASLAKASAASARRSTISASTRCASFTEKPSWRKSGGKSGPEAGLCVVASSACTVASYSGVASRRMRAGNNCAEGVTSAELPWPPLAAALGPCAAVEHDSSAPAPQTSTVSRLRGTADATAIPDDSGEVQANGSHARLPVKVGMVQSIQVAGSNFCSLLVDALTWKSSTSMLVFVVRLRNRFTNASRNACWEDGNEQCPWLAATETPQRSLMPSASNTARPAMPPP